MGAGACNNHVMTGPVSGPAFWAASKETCNKTKSIGAYVKAIKKELKTEIM